MGRGRPAEFNRFRNVILQRRERTNRGNGMRFAVAKPPTFDARRVSITPSDRVISNREAVTTDERHIF